MWEGRRVSGDKIREARLKAGLTQEGLARIVGVSTRNVVRWETGRSQPRLPHLLAVAGACRVTVFDLLEDDGQGDSDETLTREQAAMDVGFAVERLLATQ